MLLAQTYQPETYRTQPFSQTPRPAHFPPLPRSQSSVVQGNLAPRAAQLHYYSQQRAEVDFNTDAEARRALSLSPLLSLSAFDAISAVTIPRRSDPPESILDVSPASSPAALSQFSASAFEETGTFIPTPVDLMHHPEAAAWLAGGQLTPKSLSRLSHHQRESSLSSLGSAGPASPYSQNTSNPHIAVTDSAVEGYNNLPIGEELNYQLSKGQNDAFFANYPTYAADSATGSVYAPLVRKGDRGLLPPRDYSTGPNRSRPVSVASSLAGDSPAAPSPSEPEDDRRRKNGFSSVPKLDRTMTDAYNDELYSPNFAITSTSPSQRAQLVLSPNGDVFTRRLQAANSQHLHINSSPISLTSRGRSPFRQGSPLAPTSGQDFPSETAASQVDCGPAQTLKDCVKAEQDVGRFQQQLAQSSASSSTPQTISPKDAMLDYAETEGENHFPLFPQHSHNAAQYGNQHLDKALASGNVGYDSMALEATPFGFPGPVIPSTMQVPQQYPFIAQPRQQMSTLSSESGSMLASAVSPDGSGRPASLQSISHQRPVGTTADSGTYTCTYHGCTLRFETPALLQKHKREGHRQAHGIGATRRSEPVNTSAGMTSTLLNTQAGPHRCDRINPSTGKPCTTVFSRPYDLTRHEDTIHNARKQKVRCNLCTDDKTFSRADALTRHFRVCHPDVDLPGKHRRRTVHA